MLLASALRRSQLSPLRRNIVTLRSVVARPSSRIVNLQTSCLKRFETTSSSSSSSSSSSTPAKAIQSAPGKTTPQKPSIPELVCVYHIGTARVLTLALLKVSTLFIFVFFTFVVTPLYIEKEGLSTNALRTALSGLVPLLFIAYATSPFVTWILLRVPPFARQTEAVFARYITKLPPDTELEIMTMNFFAKPRASRVKVGDLRPAGKRWFGVATLTRDTTAENAKRKWYMPRAVKYFNMEANTLTLSKGKGGWEQISSIISGRKL